MQLLLSCKSDSQLLVSSCRLWSLFHPPCLPPRKTIQDHSQFSPCPLSRGGLEGRGALGQGPLQGLQQAHPTCGEHDPEGRSSLWTGFHPADQCGEYLLLLLLLLYDDPSHHESLMEGLNGYFLADPSPIFALSCLSVSHSVLLLNFVQLGFVKVITWICQNW